MSENPPEYIFQLVKDQDVENVFQFHEKNVTEFMWPRTIDELKEMVEKQCLYQVLKVKDGQISKAGICYIKDVQDEKDNIEFGGIYINEDDRGYGIGAALGIICISNHLVLDYTSNDVKIIAHVHEENESPLRLLTDDLGFKKVRTVELGIEPPESMRRNKDGKVVGIVFEFDKKTIKDFINWFKKFNNVTSGKNKDTFKIRIELPALSINLDNSLKILEQYLS